MKANVYTKNTTINVLVIVESPAKCKKIEEYLGPGYKVMASFGHLRMLDGLNAIDVKNGFKPAYTMIQEPIKLKQIEKLRSEISKATDVILATDSDREGEAIAWHLCDMFGLSITGTKRITFNEITEPALQFAIRNPTHLNMDLVYAQQARQILDLLVGFTITPFLWKCISKTKQNSLSAGRCQTPALKLIYENHLEFLKYSGKFQYDTVGIFTNMNVRFDLNKPFLSKDVVLHFLEFCKTAIYRCSTTSPKKSIRKAPEPLTTSVLQQLASNELHMSPKETMKAAQQLYEGGYITYMRTDSKKYSSEFIAKTKQYIESIYGLTYISQTIDALASDIKTNTNTNDKEKNNLVQEAHEAIRPVSIGIKDTTDMLVKTQKLYTLIWSRTLESCMPSAQYNVITAKIQSDPPFKILTDPLYNDDNEDNEDKDNCEFVHKTEQVSFAGWQIVKGTTEEKAETKAYQYFSTIKQNMLVIPKKIESNFKMIELKSHYSEARLVQLLEEKGIGRPSTFASLIDKIQEREYVSKQNIEGSKIECEDLLLTAEKEIIITSVKREFGNEKNKLVITPLGILVIEFLLKNFDTFFNYDYTRDMENALDLVATNKRTFTALCDECFTALTFVTNTNDLKEEPIFSIKIDDMHTIIMGKFGPVIRRQVPNKSPSRSRQPVTFMPVKKGLDIVSLKNQLEPITLEDVIDNTNVKSNGLIGKYKGVDLFIKKGKYGIYAQWTIDGIETRSLKELDSKPLDQIEYIEVLRILEKDLVLDPKKPVGFVRELSSTLSIRNGKFGDYIFYKKPRVKSPQFFKLNNFNEGSTKGLDARKCDKAVLLNWIKLTYGVE
jgi:DNA topoisomerase-1